MNIDVLEEKALNAVQAAVTTEAIEALRVSIVGKSGQLTLAMKGLAELPPDQRRVEGQKLNAFRDRFSKALQDKKNEIEAAELEAQLRKEHLDITLPIHQNAKGRIHPITQTIAEVTAIFEQMGFSVAEGPDVETDYYNFSALNIPENHPARQMHDTFYVSPHTEQEVPLLLRTHTSPVQVRTMLDQQPPIRIIAPGRTYRCDSDQTHTPMFHQIEGLYIDRRENVHMGHLKHCIETFCRTFFETIALPIRFRPSFFPFTEPSAEVDIGCRRTPHDGIQIGVGNDWLEIMGCGMVHPNVLNNCGIDPEYYQGFAFGMGIERLAMLKYNIPDLRTFFEGHSAWIKHYGFLPFAVNYRTHEEEL